MCRFGRLSLIVLALNLFCHEYECAVVQSSADNSTVETNLFQRSLREDRNAVGSIFSAASNCLFLGKVNLRRANGGVHISGVLKNLPKNARLGFHIHSYGDYIDPKNMCNSNGPHFNPYNKEHGCPPSKNRHAGDLGNIETDSSGVASVSITSNLITIDEGPNCVLGRSIVVHMREDDCETASTGDSGPRFGCGPIGVSPD